jgi:hypothetical protein
MTELEMRMVRSYRVNNRTNRLMCAHMHTARVGAREASRWAAQGGVVLPARSVLRRIAAAR